MNLKNPLVSVILPTFNGEKYIKNSILSVLEQVYRPIELIIINDGSQDKTEKIVLDIKKKYNKNNFFIKYIKNGKNLGLQKSLNMGLENSNGKYIARIDHDDEWLDKKKLIKQVEFLEKNKKYVMLGSGAIVIYETTGKEIFRYLNPQSDEEIRKIILRKNPFCHSSIVIKKEAIEKVDGLSLDKNYLAIEDYELYLRLGKIGKLYNINEFMVLYRLREKSVSLTYKRVQFFNSINLIRNYKNIYPNYYIGFLRNLFLYLFYFLPFAEQILRFFIKIRNKRIYQ